MHLQFPFSPFRPLLCLSAVQRASGAVPPLLLSLGCLGEAALLERMTHFRSSPPHSSHSLSHAAPRKSFCLSSVCTEPQSRQSFVSLSSLAAFLCVTRSKICTNRGRRGSQIFLLPPPRSHSANLTVCIGLLLFPSCCSFPVCHFTNCAQRDRIKHSDGNGGCASEVLSL